MIYIGIDTGVHTGVAIYNSKTKLLEAVTTMKIHAAMWLVQKIHGERDDVQVRYEDARQRTWYGVNSPQKDRARLQGAGSIKRDCQIWEDFLTSEGIEHIAVAPKHNATKMSAEAFGKITGYQGKTNEHGRDAAMLVYGL